MQTYSECSDGITEVRGKSLDLKSWSAWGECLVLYRIKTITQVATLIELERNNHPVDYPAGTK